MRIPEVVERSRVNINLYDLGFSDDYRYVWNLQKQIVEKRNLGLASNSLIIVEHDHVLTMGRNGNLQNILVRDIPVFSIERGGDVTYHGPGQIVFYPIISLSEYSLSIKQYVERLEKVLVNSLLRFGLPSEGKLGEQTGVWIGGKRKIASIGIATSHWTTYHGFALNVNTDLSHFARIRPCGFDSQVMTSMASELGVSVKMEEVKRELISAFSEIFQAEFRTSDCNNFKNQNLSVTTPEC